LAGRYLVLDAQQPAGARLAPHRRPKTGTTLRDTLDQLQLPERHERHLRRTAAIGPARRKS